MVTVGSITSLTPETPGVRPGVRQLPPAAVMLLVGGIVFAFVTRSMALSGVVLAAAFLLIAHQLPLFRTASPIERQTALLMVLVTSACLPVAAWRGETAVIHYAVGLLMFGTAFVLTRNAALYYSVSKWTLVVTQGAVFAYLATSGLANFPLERMIPGSSSNGITSYLIVLQANYCIARFTLLRRPAFITPILTIMICIVGYGRGSLLASAAIAGLNLLTLFSLKRPVRATVLAFMVLAVSAFAWIRFGDEITLFIEANTKIGSGLYDSNRERQIREYTAQLDGVALLIGGEYRGTSIEQKYNNNPHNSYIRAHHIFGLPYLIFVLLVPFLLIAGRLTLAERAYVMSALFIVIFRASTEPILFPTMLDLFYFGPCFLIAGLRPDSRGPQT